MLRIFTLAVLLLPLCAPAQDTPPDVAAVRVTAVTASPGSQPQATQMPAETSSTVQVLFTIVIGLALASVVMSLMAYLKAAEAVQKGVDNRQAIDLGRTENQREMAILAKELVLTTRVIVISSPCDPLDKQPEVTPHHRGD